VSEDLKFRRSISNGAVSRRRWSLSDRLSPVQGANASAARAARTSSKGVRPGGRRTKKPRPRGGTLVRAQLQTGHGTLLNDFARDLAARLQKVLPGRAARLPPTAVAPATRRSSLGAAGGTLSAIADRLLGMSLAKPMEAIEIALLSQAMLSAEGNITAASRILGIHRKAVERLVTKHKLRRASQPGRQRRRAGVTRTRRPKARR